MNRLALLLVILASCSLDYGKDASINPDDIPVMEFQGLKQTNMRDGRVLYTMETESSKVYQAKKQVELKNFQFQEYDSDGQMASQGTVGAAVVNTTTNDARLTGGLNVHSKEWGVTLDVSGAAGGLTWKNEDRLLASDPGTVVTLRKDDGSEISARALKLDLGANRLELEEGVTGTWTPETNDANSPAAEPAPPPAP